MGCGSSKSVGVSSNAPVAAPSKTQKVVVSSNTEETTSKSVSIASSPAAEAATTTTTTTTTKTATSTTSLATSTPLGKGEPLPTARKSSPGDSGLEEAGIITEDTAGGEELAEDGRPSTPDLMISGGRPPVRSSHVADSDCEADDPLMRDTSAASVRSAPVILQRPSSRGGSAFDISFEEDNGSAHNTPGLPRRPKRLEERQSSGKKKRDLTLDELQAKLASAEARRKEYENRLKDKMQAETKKAETYTRSQNTSLNESMEKTQTDVQEKEKHAVENREAHLRQLREKLKAKEDRARAVREKKKAMQMQSPSAPALIA